MKNEQIARAFYYGDVERTQNLYIEQLSDGVMAIFSYGQHFPISIKFYDGFLFNKNGYSNTTARHKNQVLKYIGDDLSDDDFKTTNELIKIVDLVKYDGIRTKEQVLNLLTEQKI